MDENPARGFGNWILTILSGVLIAILIWTIFLSDIIYPSAQPEPTFVTELIQACPTYEPEICPAVESIEIEPLEFELNIAPCSFPWKPSESEPPDARQKYVNSAYFTLDNLTSVKSDMLNLRTLMLSNGIDKFEREDFLIDDTWLALNENIRIRVVGGIRTTITNMWPPGPNNDCSPLLDAHARLLNAFVIANQMVDNWNSLIIIEDTYSMMTYFTDDHWRQFDSNIEYARWGLGETQP